MLLAPWPVEAGILKTTYIHHAVPMCPSAFPLFRVFNCTVWAQVSDSASDVATMRIYVIEEATTRFRSVLACK